MTMNLKQTVGFAVLLLLCCLSLTEALALIPKNTARASHRYLWRRQGQRHRRPDLGSATLPSSFSSRRLQQRYASSSPFFVTSLSAATEASTEAVYDQQELINSEQRELLLSLVQSVPSGRATPPALTQQILNCVRTLERRCPTRDADLLTALAGSWELAWTAQDPSAPESRRFWIINPIENQAYSNNPEGGQQGRSNPFLPMALQNQLEKAGFVTAAPIRSTQSIDIKSGLIRNIVAVNVNNNNNSNAKGKTANNASSPLRRASLTVTIQFYPVQMDARKVNVRFKSCRVSVPSLNLDWNFPLGFAGPTGWLRTAYIDDSLRITRGHKGSVFVLVRPKRASV